jgi:hypothetical protein
MKILKHYNNILMAARASTSSPVSKSQHTGVSDPGITYIFLPPNEGTALDSITCQ